MTWVVWRQHRAESLITLGVLAALAVFLLITGLEMHYTFQHQESFADCMAHLQERPGGCGFVQGGLPSEFWDQYQWLVGFPIFLLPLPVLLGALVGAPLVAREVEQRTFVLAWTQSISRVRWLGVKLALVLGAGVLLFGVLLAEVIWWWGPFAQYQGSFSGNAAFDFTGPVLPAAALLALSLGVFAGALTRRTVLAIFLTLALFLAIRLPVEMGWRPHFLPPITVTWPIEQTTPPVTVSVQDWLIDSGLIDAQSKPYKGAVLSYCDNPESFAQCAQSQGFQAYYLTYQPADRFWTFQWMETGIYVGVAALALLATVWLVRRRLS
ncbi:MAG TPA: hypothetical protein VH599_09915 [Ktedonobacterales bacterium]|jgi:hypothetical protein